MPLEEGLGSRVNEGWKECESQKRERKRQNASGPGMAFEITKSQQLLLLALGLTGPVNNQSQTGGGA